MKKHLNHISVALLAVASAIAIYSCGDDTCEGNQSSLPQAGFYSSQTKAAITVDSITIYGVGVPNDSAIVRNSKIQNVYLPFNVDAQESKFVIRYEQKDLAKYNITDTIAFTYTCEPYFHSKECGAFYVFNVTGQYVSHNLIDSMQLAKPVIDNADIENIRLFFRTEEEREQ